jgi:hypothetical protein
VTTTAAADVLALFVVRLCAGGRGEYHYLREERTGRVHGCGAVSRLWEIWTCGRAVDCSLSLPLRKTVLSLRTGADTLWGGGKDENATPLLISGRGVALVAPGRAGWVLDWMLS